MDDQPAAKGEQPAASGLLLLATDSVRLFRDRFQVINGEPFAKPRKTSQQPKANSQQQLAFCY